jgi:serine/threonine-protein kinase RsbW
LKLLKPTSSISNDFFRKYMDTSIQFNSKFENLNVVEKFLEEICSSLQLNNDNFGNILIAVTEAVNNAIQHGNKFDENKNINLEFVPTQNKLSFIVKDQGQGFDPSTIPDPTEPENIEKPNGRGVFLMKNLADEIEYFENGSTIKLNFNIAS